MPKTKLERFKADLAGVFKGSSNFNTLFEILSYFLALNAGLKVTCSNLSVSEPTFTSFFELALNVAIDRKKNINNLLDKFQMPESDKDVIFDIAITYVDGKIPFEPLFELSKVLKDKEDSKANLYNFLDSFDTEAMHQDKDVDWKNFEFTTKIKMAAGKENNRKSFLMSLWDIADDIIGPEK
jgi:hypothetical protein